MAYIARSPEYGAFEKQTLTADGSTTTFALNFTVGSSSSVLVSVAGVVQEPEVGYSLSGGGANIVFSTAPASSDTVFVIFLGLARDVADFENTGFITNKTELSSVANDDLLLIYDNDAAVLKKIQKSNLDTSLDITGKTDLTTGLQGADELVIYDNSAASIKKVNLDNLVTGQTAVTSLADDDVFLVYDTSSSEIKKVEKQYVATSSLTYTNGTFTGDGSTTTITIDSGRAVDDVLVHVNGFLLVPTTDYTISGTTLTFTTAPASSAEISVRYLPLTGAATYTNDTATGDGSTTAFTIDSGRSVEDVIVSVNGVTLVPTTDYTISGTTLTFTTAPASSAEISIRYLRLT
jgi:hypothetical protein